MEREEVMEILSSTASGVEDGCVVTETQWGAIRALKQRGLSHLCNRSGARDRCADGQEVAGNRVVAAAAQGADRRG